MRQRLKPLSVLLSCILISACNSTTYELDENFSQSNVPQNWQHEAKVGDVVHSWLTQINNAQLHTFVKMALNNNFALKQQAYSLEMKKQELIIAGSALWPSLDLAVSSNGRKTTSPSAYTNNASVDLNFKYEIDLWGKLSDSDKQANLDYLSQKANFEQTRQQLVADVVIAWFQVIEAQRLTLLYQKI